jgi:hypothetical protein
VFDMIVEGTSTDNNTSKLSGQSGPCQFTESGHVVETTTYLRGRGVRVEFVRYGRTVLVQRVGRTGDSSLAARVTIHRTAEGGTHSSPITPGVPCTVPDTDLSSNPDCGKDIPLSNAAFLLSYRAGRLGLAVSPRTALGGSVADDCGADPQTGASDLLRWSFPTPPDLEPAPLPERVIFGHRRAFKVTLRWPDAPTPSTLARPISVGTFTGTVTDSATNRATIRFVRR